MTRTARHAAAAIGLGTLLALFILRAVVIPVRVTGESMEPAIYPGDVVIVLAPALARGWIRPGSVIVATAPAEGGGAPLMVVKRVSGVRTQAQETWLELAGDNSGASRDSRIYGPIPFSALRGLVVMRLPGWRQRPAAGNRALSPAGR